jgi:hypothetical protein
VSPKIFDTFFFKISYFYFSRAPRSRALKFFFKFFSKILQRFHQTAQLQQQPAAAASSNAK